MEVCWDVAYYMKLHRNASLGTQKGFATGRFVLA